MGVTDNILSHAHLFPQQGLPSTIHYYLVTMMSCSSLSVCLFPLSFRPLKISGAVRHVGICLMPIILMTAATMSEIGEGRHVLTAQTSSSEPASPLSSCALQRAALAEWKAMLICSIVSLVFIQPTLETTKAQALLIIYTKQQTSHMAGLYW